MHQLQTQILYERRKDLNCVDQYCHGKFHISCQYVSHFYHQENPSVVGSINSLTYMICITDVGYSVVGFHVYTAFAWFAKELNCSIIFLMRFLLEFFVIVPTVITLLVIIDRFLHIKYLSRYSSVFTTKRYRISLGVSIITSVFLSVLSVLVGATFTRFVHNMVRLGYAMLLLLISCTIYLVSYFRLKKLQKERRYLSENTKDITRIASLYLLLTILTKVLPVTIGLVQMIGRIQVSVLFMTYLHVPVATIFNAIIFLCVNRPAKRYIMNSINRIRVTIGSKEVAPSR